jgi:hypothetical protein
MKIDLHEIRKKTVSAKQYLEGLEEPFRAREDALRVMEHFVR